MFGSLILTAVALAGDASAPTADKPITTAGGEIGRLLKQWYAEGVAAGNFGDWYDNRDGGHSKLNAALHPQIQKITYTEQDRKEDKHWEWQKIAQPLVVLGNSSTALPVPKGGSNPRKAYRHAQGLQLLHDQYRHNNLYIYPEHLDHDVGHNGSPGYGDVFPTNTPYLIISQGSSGTDQPFMHAVAFTLAAFQPEVKKKLSENGLLMPTVQMIFRSSNKHLTDPKEYLTGKAHPSVFEGSWVDNLKMIQMAHDIKLDNLPPLVQLKVIEEDQNVNGRDFFEAGGVECLGAADTPEVIARVVRGKSYMRRIVVSAETSFDLNQHPLTFHWVTLRGDAEKIKIKPLNEAHSRVEILVPYHDRQPIAPGSPLESNRVDIGVFAHNGMYYSAPAFITFVSLDHEARTYDADGRILEIGYSMGETALTVSDWTACFYLLKPDATTWLAQFFKKQFKETEIAALLKISEEYKTLQAGLIEPHAKHREAAAAHGAAAANLRAAEGKKVAAKTANEKILNDETTSALNKCEADHAAAEKSLKEANVARQAAQKALNTATQVVTNCLEKKMPDLDISAQNLVHKTLVALWKNPDFFRENAKEIQIFLQTQDTGRKARIADARQRLINFGLLKDQPAPAFELQPLRQSAAPLAERLTRYEKMLLERFQAEILAGLLYKNALSSSFRVYYVAPEISEPPTWRDVYRYDAQGHELGWVRFGHGQPEEFNADGLLVMEKDDRGRCVKARVVKYESVELPEKEKKNPPWPHWRPLKQVFDNEIWRYNYATDDDWKGQVMRQP
ncbi:MAG: hypothetical protein V1899_06340 [Planctomycetota bacterium]